MNHRRALSSALCSLAALALIPLAASAAPAGPPIKITQTQNTLEITIDGKPFTTYRFNPTPDDPEWHRPYFFPVLSADGVDLTSDQWRLQQAQPDAAAKKKIDHPWHRSVYIAHGDINGLDHWTHKSGEKKLQNHLKFTQLDDTGFIEELAWEGKEPGKPVLTEVRTVRFLAYADGARSIDVTTKITAASGDAVFKVKPLNVSGVEAGWLAVRVNPSISAAKGKHVITSSAGVKGEKDSRLKPADWCDYSGPIGDKTYGVAEFDHPANPGHPTPFHVREFGMITHIGIHDWTLKAGDSQSFRHLLLFHPGDAASAQLDERYKEFAAPAR